MFKFKTAGILVFMVLLFAIVSIGSVSATTINVDPTSDIQGVIDNATDGDVINFTQAPVYTGNGWVINNKSLTFEGNGVKVAKNTSLPDTVDIFSFNNTNGFIVRNFYLDLMGTTSYGISASDCSNSVITNNTIVNGGTAINVFRTYENMTITYNTITNFTQKNGDGISIVDHTEGKNMTSWVESTIAYNTIDSVDYGIFVGGNFKGSITGNNVTNANTYGIQFVGKQDETNGVVNATITGNTLNSSNIGLALETPTYDYLYLDNNNIQGNNNVVEIGSLVNDTTVINPFIVTNNNFYGGNTTFADFYNLSDDFEWSNNYLNGVPYN